QPAEVMKLGFIVYLAAWLNTHHKNIKRLEVLVPLLVLLGVLATLLILQPNFSTLLLVCCIGGAMYFVAGAPVRLIAGFGIVGVLGSWVLVRIAPYRFNRILAFLDPSGDPLGISYQVNQAFISIGSGRWFGTGIFQGIQKQTFLPEPMNDSIYAVWAEETGFIGASLLIILFVIFLWRVMRIVERAEDRFVKFAALGIGVWIFLQASINIGAMVGILPLTGMPLPFISYGSSSLIAALAASGLLLQFSKETS
ncbi:MAG: FtsW/RodA/SpoVE family cell cycle protein, partial [Candidatus Spechtbacterales bacterium]